MAKKEKKGRSSSMSARLQRWFQAVATTCYMTVLVAQPVAAADTLWTRISTIVADVYGQLVGISTIQTGTGTVLIPQASSTSTGTAAAGNSGSVYYPPAEADSPGSSDVTVSSSNKFTLPDGLYYSDGSLGRLKIPALDLSVKVYEDESLESLSKGAGHFKFTSCWDGNVGLAGHNRGVANHFGKIHTLRIGNKITYTTKLGTRTYEVFFVGKIKETDFSRLERSNENLITLITCVRDVPNMRWCVQAREVT